jgi:hypothetical protein
MVNARVDFASWPLLPPEISKYMNGFRSSNIKLYTSSLRKPMMSPTISKEGWFSNQYLYLRYVGGFWVFSVN